MEHVKANGAVIPALGLGTWRLEGEHCARIVAEGLRLGYRHVDTAQMYDNERAVGQGLVASGLSRSDVFLTTKIWPDCLAPGVLERTAEERLELLGVDYVDLLLIHWPAPDIPLRETMPALAATRRAGLTRHIGVSNFNVALIEEAVATCPEPLVTNQVEYHPFLEQGPVLTACRRHGLSLTAYCPIARGKVDEDPTIREIARHHGRSPAQVALRWLIQQPGVMAIPKTGSPDRLAENLAAADFSLDDDEMAAIHALGSPRGRMVEAATAPRWD